MTSMALISCEPKPELSMFFNRAYIDFARLHNLSLSCSYFVTRAKSNMQFNRLYSQLVNRSLGVIHDQTIRLTGFYPSKVIPTHCVVLNIMMPNLKRT